MSGITHGSGGRDDSAPYVTISPPAPLTDDTFDDVARIVLMADVRPTMVPRCSPDSESEHELETALRDKRTW